MNSEEKLSDRICNQIRQDISSGKYKGGDKIPPEPELMKLYGVGRSTIREAVKTLVTNGVLHVRQGVGTTVSTAQPTDSLDNRLKRADFDEINTVRKLLEKEIVLLAVSHHNTAHLDEMAQWLGKRRNAIEQEDRQQCMDADIGFHMAIAHAAGNRVLFDLYESFTQLIRNFFQAREAKGVSHFALTHHLHEQLYQAIKAKKAKAAQQVLEQILNNNY